MEWLEILFVVALGVSLGSFVTLASWRLPRDEDVAVTPSRCTSCGARLRALDLFPVLSWIASGGKCRHCKAPVHWRYPAIELVSALALLLIYAQHGLSVEAGILALLAVGLLILIVADFEHYIIPDEVHWLLLPLGLFWRFWQGAPWEDTLGGFALGLSLGLTLYYGYSAVRKKQMLGFGDVKFFAVAGVWLGLLPFVPFLSFAGLFGIITGVFWRAIRQGGAFPFGPALALSLFVCVLYPEAVGMFWGIFDR